MDCCSPQWLKTKSNFTKRVNAGLFELKSRGKTVEDSNLEEMDSIWNEVKKQH